MSFRAVLIAGFVLAFAPAPASAATPPPTRDVLVVSNNWAGTADFIDTKTFKRVKRLNIIPDAAEREAEIQSDPADLFYYQAIRELVGEGITSTSTTRSPRRTGATCTCRVRRSRTSWPST